MGVLGLAVFEVLSFVSDHAEERNRFKEFEVANEGAVRGDDEVGFAKGSRFLGPVGSVVNEDGKIGTESLGFSFPVLKLRAVDKRCLDPVAGHQRFDDPAAGSEKRAAGHHMIACLERAKQS